MTHTHVDTKSHDLRMNNSGQVCDSKISCIDAQLDAEAVCMDGSIAQGSKRLAGLGSRGKQPGNCARDFRRQVLKKYDSLLPTYEVKVPFASPCGNGMTTGKQYMHLPHEYFAYLHHWPDEFESRVTGATRNSCADFWAKAPLSAWFASHPARPTIESAPGSVVPVRLYGDDASYQKLRSALVLTWSSVTCRLPSMQSRFLITVLPLGDATDETHKEIYTVVQWSFKHLLSGFYPAVDHLGQTWPASSWRSRAAGKPLAGGVIAALAQVLRDTIQFKSYNYVCHASS